MFNFFKNLNQNTFLGIDFGTASVKIIELRINNQKPELVNYGWAEFDVLKTAKDSKLEYADAKPKAYLRALIKKMNPQTAITYASIPSFNGLVTLIEFPDMDKDELAEAIEFEAHKYIPSSMDDVAISWDVVSRKENSFAANSSETLVKKIQVLLVAAPREKVDKYEKLMAAAKLKIKATELETFSLARSLVGEDPGTYIIVDIGFCACTIVLVEKGIPKVNRSIDVGGSDITNAIAENLNISKERAEAMKRQGKDLINGQETAIILPALESIVSEVSRIIATFKSKAGNPAIDSIILSGGTANMAGITEYFFKTLNVKTVLGDPWKKIIYDEKLAPLIKKMGSSFSVSVGLALRGVEDAKKK